MNDEMMECEWPALKIERLPKSSLVNVLPGAWVDPDTVVGVTPSKVTRNGKHSWYVCIECRDRPDKLQAFDSQSLAEEAADFIACRINSRETQPLPKPAVPQVVAMEPVATDGLAEAILGHQD